MIIYKITNLTNKKVYIGQTNQPINRRWNTHKRAAKNKVNRHLYDSINHYGINNFIIEQIDSSDTKEELDKKEKSWIVYYKSNLREFGYNMTEGGESRYKGSSHPMFGKNHTKESRIKIGLARKGKPLKDFMSNDSYKKHIETMKKNFCGEANHNYKPISKEQIEDLLRKKLSEKHLMEELKISKWTLYSKLTKLFGHSKLSLIRKSYE